MSRTAGRHPGIIEDQSDIRTAVRALRRRCAILRSVHDLVGDPPLRRQPAGFEGLARIVVAQQVSAASASAIWTRTQHVLQSVTAAHINHATDSTLRTCGLSRPKILTLRALAEATTRGDLDFEKLDRARTEDIHATLTRIRGIGPWTADIYTMFSLGHADAWAAGDLALQVSIGRAFALPERPTAVEAQRIAEQWRPWRAVAARLLWSFHAIPAQPQERPPASPKKLRRRAT